MTAQPKGYHKLVAFQASHELVRMIYSVTESFPKTEQFGLTSQMRRAAVSVAANIVEGYALSTTAQFLRHLSISFGSCKEVEYYIQLANELGYINDVRSSEANGACGRAAYLITALTKSLRAKISAADKATTTRTADDSVFSPLSLLSSEGNEP